MVEAKGMPPFKGAKLKETEWAAAAKVQSNSIAQGLARFGLADIVSDKADFAVGDIVTLARDVSLLNKEGKVIEPAGTGHSGLFVGWLSADQKLLPPEGYEPSLAKGFVYFSSQSNYVRTGSKLKSVSGLGLRAAYFTGFCPQDPQNRIDPGKNNCMDQRIQDKADYKTNYRNYAKSYPMMSGDLKPDCCVDPRSLKVGRIRPIAKWEYATAAPKVVADCDSVAMNLVGKKCPRP